MLGFKGFKFNVYLDVVAHAAPPDSRALDCMSAASAVATCLCGCMAFDLVE